MNNIELQKIEDENYYLRVREEAKVQFQNLLKGWIIDPSRGRLLCVYNVYDKETAKYLNTNTLNMCTEMALEMYKNYKNEHN